MCVPVGKRSPGSRTRFVFGGERKLIQARRGKRVVRKIIQRQYRYRNENVIRKFGDAGTQQRSNDELGAISNGRRIRGAGPTFTINVVDTNGLMFIETGDRREIGAEKTILYCVPCGCGPSRQRQQQCNLPRVVERQFIWQLEVINDRKGRVCRMRVAPAHGAVNPPDTLLAG